MKDLAESSLSVGNLSEEELNSYESNIFIGGDVADSFDLAEKFYRRLRYYYPKNRIFAVLGNHEISEFDTLEEAVSKYGLLFRKLKIKFSL